MALSWGIRTSVSTTAMPRWKPAELFQKDFFWERQLHNSQNLQDGRMPPCGPSKDDGDTCSSRRVGRKGEGARFPLDLAATGVNGAA